MRSVKFACVKADLRCPHPRGRHFGAALSQLSVSEQQRRGRRPACSPPLCEIKYKLLAAPRPRESDTSSHAGNAHRG